VSVEHDVFWLVWNPKGYTPQHRHKSRGSACAEAERLAGINPGQVFYTLRAEEARVVDSMQRVILDNPREGLPF